MLNSCFCLQGRGYLQDVVMRPTVGNPMVARIQVLTAYDASQPPYDDVWLDLEITGQHHAYFRYLLTLVQAGRAVLITFSAQYKAFEQVYADSLESQPASQIVILQAVLEAVVDSYADGQPVDNYPMTHRQLLHSPVLVA